MTVAWATYAQSRTSKPVKGMLTGPVTMLAWSFVRDDQPLGDTARQVALALRDEIHDLEAAGIRIIQVDEPALRELLPLRRAEHQDYLRWAVGAFRLATSGAAASTQIHTHMCYSEFGEIIGAIEDLDADVTSIEAARSHMELLAGLRTAGLHPRHRPRRLRHPLAPRPVRRGDGRRTAARPAERRARAAVGQSRLRPEDPRLRRGRAGLAQPGRRGPASPPPAGSVTERRPACGAGERPAG